MASGSGDAFWSEDPSMAETSDVELLKRAWRNEKVAPEILQFEASLVQRVRQQIQSLEETLEEFSGNGTDNLMLSFYQMDLDRALFLLRSYLRIRLQKIERYMIHISKTELWNRLSEQEQKFAKKCTDFMEKHLDQSVLSRLPYGYQSILKQSISSEEDDMLPAPQLDTFVFCKSKGSVGSFQLDDASALWGGTADQDSLLVASFLVCHSVTTYKLPPGSGDEIVDLVADDLYILRYKSIKALVESGRIDLV